MFYTVHCLTMLLGNAFDMLIICHLQLNIRHIFVNNSLALIASLPAASRHSQIRTDSNTRSQVRISGGMSVSGAEMSHYITFSQRSTPPSRKNVPSMPQSRCSFSGEYKCRKTRWIPFYSRIHNTCRSRKITPDNTSLVANEVTI
jgi:hypothetical protein